MFVLYSIYAGEWKQQSAGSNVKLWLGELLLESMNCNHIHPVTSAYFSCFLSYERKVCTVL